MAATSPRPITSAQVAGGFALAVATLCLGAWLNLKADPNPGTTILHAFWYLAVFIVAMVTFAVGRRRGFPLRDAAGAFSITNLLRNAVATVIACGCLALLAGPFVLAIFRFAR